MRSSSGSLIVTVSGTGSRYWQLLQGEAEVFVVRRAQRLVGVQGLLGAPGGGGPDEGAPADRDPPVTDDPRADGPLGEVRRGRRRLPPAGRLEVGQGPRPPLDAVLRLAVLEHLHVALAGVGQAEPPTRVHLLVATV